MRVRVSAEVVERELSGELLLFHLKKGTYFGLDPIGTRIWQLLAELGTSEAATAALLREYKVAEPRLRREVLALVRKLVAQGLLAVERD